jgi:hypothetical protein
LDEGNSATTALSLVAAFASPCSPASCEAVGEDERADSPAGGGAAAAALDDEAGAAGCDAHPDETTSRQVEKGLQFRMKGFSYLVVSSMKSSVAILELAP